MAKQVSTEKNQQGLEQWLAGFQGKTYVAPVREGNGRGYSHSYTAEN